MVQTHHLARIVGRLFRFAGIPPFQDSSALSFSPLIVTIWRCLIRTKAFISPRIRCIFNHGQKHATGTTPHRYLRGLRDISVLLPQFYSHEHEPILATIWSVQPVDAILEFLINVEFWGNRVRWPLNGSRAKGARPSLAVADYKP